MMIAIDTDILVRYLAQDDRAQAPLATALFEGRLSAAEPGFISMIVLCETIRVLERLYDRSRAEIAGIIEGLIESAQIVVDEADIVRDALAHPDVALTDAIVQAVARDRGCEQTLTFDRNFSRLPGVELLTAWRAS
jgi:predicted nucleic-acid-binding protein